MPKERRPNLQPGGFQNPSPMATMEDLALAEASKFVNSTDFAHTYDLFRIGDHASVRVEIRPKDTEGEISVNLFCCAFEPRLVDWSKLRITVAAEVSGFARLDATGTVQLVLNSPSILSLRATPMPMLHSEAYLNLAFAAAPIGNLHGGPRWQDVIWRPDDSDLQIAFQLRDGILIVAAFTTVPRSSIRIRIAPGAGEAGLIEVLLTLENDIPLEAFEDLKLEPIIQEKFSGYIGNAEFPFGIGDEQCVVTLV